MDKVTIMQTTHLAALKLNRPARPVWLQALLWTVLTASAMALLLASLDILSGCASAQVFGGNLPWERPICDVAKSLSGPVAKAVLVIATVMTGLMWAMGEAGSMFKKAAAWIFGAAIAVGAVSIVSSLFGFNIGQCSGTGGLGF